MIPFSSNDFTPPVTDQPWRPGEELWAEYDAMVDPAASGSFEGSIADVLAAADPHAHAVPVPVRGCRWCQDENCDCPRPPAPGSVGGWLADLAARPVDAWTRLALHVVDPAQVDGPAVRDLLTVTDKVLAADTATQYAGVLAVADTVRAEIDQTLSELPLTRERTGWGQPDTDRMIREDLARTLRVSGTDAQRRVEVAGDLRDRLPVARGLLAAGMLSARKAGQLSALLGATRDEVAAQVDAELAPQAQRSLPASLRRRVARRILKLDPDHAAAQDTAVVRDRRVRHWTDVDGSATLALTGPPDQVQRAWIALTGTALAQLRACHPGCHPGCPHALTAAVIRDENHQHDQPTSTVRPTADTSSDTDPGTAPPGVATSGVRPRADTRTRPTTEVSPAGVRPPADTEPAPLPGQPAARAAGWLDRARFDAAVDLMSAVFDAPWYAGGPGRRRTLVQLVTTADTLTGADDALSVLVGHGPVTAETARRVAADADLYQDVLVHPGMGFLLDAGTIRHDPPERLREFLLARRPQCSLPDCDQPAATGDLDHGIDHRPDGTGGPTAAWAMSALCRFHHRARTLRLWRPSQQRSDGSLLWTDHTGRAWYQPAHDLRPDPG